MATLDIDRVFSSPFLRAVETAHLAAHVIDEPVVLEPGLGEWLNPDWFDTRPDTLSPPALASRFDRLEPRPSAGPCREPTYPESKHEALARLGSTAQCLAERYEAETLVLVGHGVTVQGALHGLVGEDVPNPGCPLASLTKVVGRGESWSIELRNDTSHLENGVRATDRLA